MYKDHYIDVLMSAMASQITVVSIVCSTFCSGIDQRKYQSSGNGVFPSQRPSNPEMFPFDNIIMRHWRDNTSLCNIRINKKTYIISYFCYIASHSAWAMYIHRMKGSFLAIFRWVKALTLCYHRPPETRACHKRCASSQSSSLSGWIMVLLSIVCRGN